MNKNFYSLLASLRGLPKENNQIHYNVKKFNQVIDDLIIKDQFKILKPHNIILHNWKHIIGNRYAHLVYPHSILPSGILKIKVTNAIVRNEIIFLRQNILKRLRDLPYCKNITNIIIEIINN